MGQDKVFNNLHNSAENGKAPSLHGSADVSSLIFLCNLNMVSKPQELYVNLSVNLFCIKEFQAFAYESLIKGWIVELVLPSYNRFHCIGS